VTEVAGEACFIKSISVGKYRVGSISRVSNFDFQKLASAMEAENSLLIATQSGRLFAGGSVDWSDELWDAGGGGLGSRRDRITVSVPFPAIDGELVWGVQSASLFDKGTRFVGSALLVSSMVCILLIVTLITVLREKVDNPVKHLLHAHKEIGGGNIQYRISQEPGSTEFETLFESFNSMADQIQNLRIESYDKTIREQEYQLQIVRAQLKPHFYLNAITTVSNMTYQNRVEDIRAFVQALGRYMRYMMNIQSDMVPVAEELSHIVNYMEMQQIRFPGSVDYTIACMEEVRGLRIPFLVLFTLVENAFKHALDLYKSLLLRIDCRPARQNGLSGYALSVEDNGGGFPQEVLDNFNGELPEGELPPKEHLGLTNIRYTLRYSYHRQASLRLLNTETGAKAVIWIPSGEGAKEEK
jgi:two-component system sensor histidine kinase YesM